MQIDFHYAGTYAIARLAGFPHGQASVIAYAAQYVDDATNEGEIVFNNGTKFIRIATAHTMVSPENFENVENEKSWMPFHFLPGNEGLSCGKTGNPEMVRRLICTTDSPIAHDVREACMKNKSAANHLHRLGIASHVYVDTWVHKEFAGLKHSINRIRSIETDQDGLTDLCDDVKSGLTSMLGIGHGAVLTFPDLPFAVWRYTDRDTHEVTRDNPDLFLKATKHLFAFYKAYLGEGAYSDMEPRDLDVFQEAFTSFNSPKGENRLEDWLEFIKKGKFSFGPLSREEGKDLDYKPKGEGSWKHLALGTTAPIDMPGRTYAWTPGFETSHWKYFHMAALEHRNLVMNKLLPNYGLEPSRAN